MTVSLIVYGRNDQVGYNAHKRVALSLNAMAEVLTHPDDEILFTDYNTEDSMPTQLEAISDTLTPKSKRLIRILRVRPRVHAKFAKLTNAQVNEPLARNVAIRRSNPKNKWILSTNTDMIFIPQEPNKSLSDIIAELKETKYYAISRFELPETLWESLDRKMPKKAIRKISEFGQNFHLNEITLTIAYNYYDAPGDFQLVPREHVFELGGFNEEMIHGWHVDSNFARRHSLLYSMPESLQDKVFGYHTSHTKLPGWTHHVKAFKMQNDYNLFCDVITPYVDSQTNTWGLNNEIVEEIRLNNHSDNTSTFASMLEAITPTPLDAPIITNMRDVLKEENYENPEAKILSSLNFNHIFPYLLEHLTHLPKDTNVLYIGTNHAAIRKLTEFAHHSLNNYKIYYLELLELFGSFENQATAGKLQQPIKLELKKHLDLLRYTNYSPKDIVAKVKELNINAIILDCGIDELNYDRFASQLPYRPMGKIFKKTYQNFLQLLSKEQGSSRYRKIIGLGFQNVNFRNVFTSNVHATQAPFTTRIMHGYPKIWNKKSSFNIKLLNIARSIYSILLRVRRNFARI